MRKMRISGTLAHFWVWALLGDSLFFDFKHVNVQYVS
jgi:hypothetical protein